MHFQIKACDGGNIFNFYVRINKTFEAFSERMQFFLNNNEEKTASNAFENLSQ